eukprot:7199919-Pyramimonas_sp.AAC.1
MDDETFPYGPASVNMFRRSSLPPTPDKRQGQPRYRDPTDGDRDVTVGHAAAFREKRLYATTEERHRMLQATPEPLKQTLRDAHITGPVPPNVEAIRHQTGITLRYMAEFVEDPIFATLA